MKIRLIAAAAAAFLLATAAVAAPVVPEPLAPQSRSKHADEQSYFEVMKKEAALGSHWAIYELGLLYLTGAPSLGVAQDTAAAIKNLALAAEQGNGTASRTLGDLQWRGEKVVTNRKSAMQWYEVGAQSGDAESAARLARILDEGDGVPRDQAKALHYFRMAAGNTEKPSAYAQSVLGFRYLQGTGGLARDLDKARAYLLPAATSGNQLAQYNLGHMLLSAGTEAEKKKGVEWLEVAAQSGSIEANNLLATLYSRGQFVEKNSGVSAAYADASRRLSGKPPVQTDISSKQSPAASIDRAASQKVKSESEGAPAKDGIRVKVVAPYANLRRQPDQKSDVLGKLDRGVTLKVIAKSGEWMRIEIKDASEQTGWIHSSLVAKI